MTRTLDAFALSKLRGLEARSLRRTLQPTHRIDGLWVERGGQRLRSFSCNDYLGLAHHPQVRSAAVGAIEDFGAGAGASRLVTGDHPLLGALEQELAAFKGTEASVVFGSGYLANLGIIPTFVGAGDLVLLDELAHSCMWAGARLSGALVLAFRHNDACDAHRLLETHRGHVANVLVATEGVFSMDGDLGEIAALSALCREQGAWLLVDDAHGLGVLSDGRGAGADLPQGRIDLHVGTLSKALGSYGAYVCTSRAAADLIVTRTRSLIYSTGLPPASAAAALAGLRTVIAEPELTRRPLRLARQFTRALALPEAQSAIVPIMLGEAHRALAAASDLERRGFLVAPIRAPTVPDGAARLRVAFTAKHEEQDVQELARAMKPWLAQPLARQLQMEAQA